MKLIELLNNNKEELIEKLDELKQEAITQFNELESKHKLEFEELQKIFIEKESNLNVIYHGKYNDILEEANNILNNI